MRQMITISNQDTGQANWPSDVPCVPVHQINAILSAVKVVTFDPPGRFFEDLVRDPEHGGPLLELVIRSHLLSPTLC